MITGRASLLGCIAAAWLRASAAPGAADGSPPPAAPSVSASSVHAGPYDAERAVDGNPGTRWASRGAEGPQWLHIDFGAPAAVSGLTIAWEAAYAVEYEIQGSEDGRTWRSLARKTDGQGGRESFSGFAGETRHLRILCLKPAPFNLYSIWEIEFAGGGAAARFAEARRQAEQTARAAALEQLASRGVTQIVFAVRKAIPEHWYANFSYLSFDNGDSPGGDSRKLYRDGGRLCRLDPRSGDVTTILDDPLGGVRDPQVDYDGRRILFSYRRGGMEHYHLCEVNADGSGLRELTTGPWDDIEPTYVSDGGIVFVSSRGKRWVNCWLSQVAILYRCAADGSDIRPLSSNNEHDNTPWPLPDGRLLYTRWEYVNRSQVDYHHLWTANPDGTAQTVFFGNLHPGTVYIDAKPVPGSDTIVASFSPGHGRTEHEGRIGLIDPRGGPDAQTHARAITADDDYRDPWAFSEDCFLAARGAAIVLVDGRGREQVIHRLSDPDAKDGCWCHEPRPLVPRPREARVAARTRLEEPTGRMMLANVYQGRNMAGVNPGEIEHLLVLETLPKPVNFTGGMDPLSYVGTFTLARTLKTVPVEPDGSAFFEVPALRSVFFVPLDARGLAVKHMQSFAMVMPGETTGCVGCHEPRTQVAATRAPPRAARRPPSRIEPVAGVPDVLDFPRDIQPILDRHCLRCHDTAPRKGGVILAGDRGPMFSHSYYTLSVRRQLGDNRNQPRSNYPPYGLGSGAAPLMRKLTPAHHDVQATDRERRTVALWLDSGAAYPGTYASLGTGMIGGYQENQQVLHNDAEWPATKVAVEAFGRRCATCHGEGPMRVARSLSDENGLSFWRPDLDDPRLLRSRHAVFNLTHPDQSLVLLAPLAREAGGLGLCHPPGPASNASRPALFADRNDPDYGKILAMCEAGRRRLEEIGRFDMPGFRPRREWIREMQRYGVLPSPWPENAPIDCYAVEQAYWRSLWHRPETARRMSPARMP